MVTCCWTADGVEIVATVGSPIENGGSVEHLIEWTSRMGPPIMLTLLVLLLVSHLLQVQLHRGVDHRRKK